MFAANRNRIGMAILPLDLPSGRIGAMSDQNAVLALQNAWNGVVAASAEVEKMAPGVAALPETATIDTLDLQGYRRATLAQASAVMALCGLVEELQRKIDTGKQA